MTFYCHSLLTRLKIDPDEWNAYLIAASKETLFISPGAYNRAFLGVPGEKGTYLTTAMKEELNNLKIHPFSQYYRHGLISVRTHKDEKFNLIELNRYLKYKLAFNIWLRETILAAQLIQLLLRIRLKTNRIEEIILLVNERDFIYAQIACYALPPTFLQQIINPCHFVEEIAPQLGRYLTEQNETKHHSLGHPIRIDESH